MPTTFLVAPVHVAALALEVPTTVVSAMADFSRLPYFDGAVDQNTESAYISEELVSQPFENLDLQLEPGVHLHWSLPAGLTRGRSRARPPESAPSPPLKRGDAASGAPDLDFDPVPTCWLVMRRTDADLECWVVESDYLYPDRPEEAERARLAGSRAFPYPLDADPHRAGRPFRYLGRSLPLNEWTGTGTYLGDDADRAARPSDRLTAVGYGDPSFATFYPNCRNLFGFHDPHPPAPGTTYTVVGWYRDPKNDVCAARDWDALRHDFGWVLDEAANEPKPDPPKRLLCVGQVRLADGATTDGAMDGEMKVAFGNTATEALSAFLADLTAKDVRAADGETPDDAKRRFEEQLEALHLLPTLEHRPIDTGPKFQEARHERGFRSAAGGSIWTIRPLPPSAAPADPTHAQPQPTLPLDLAHQLNQLNLAQQEYDAAVAELASWRERLFADWYKYVLCAYPPLGQAGEYPDLDEVRCFLEEALEGPFETAVARVGDNLSQLRDKFDGVVRALGLIQLVIPEDIVDWPAFLQQARDRKEEVFRQLRDPIPADPEDELPADAGDRIVEELCRLVRQQSKLGGPEWPGGLPAEAQALAKQGELTGADLMRYNRLLLQAAFPALARRAPHKLAKIPAGPFSEPAEPVVLLVGGAARAMEGDSLAGELTCWLVRLEEEQPFGRPDDVRKRVESGEIDRVVGAAVDLARKQNKPIARDCTSRPWRPFMLEWQVELRPTGGECSNLHPAARTYGQDFITTYYRLEDDARDLTPNGAVQAAAEYSTYSGRSFLTPHAKPVLLRRIDDYLDKRVLPEYFRQNPDKVPDPPQRADYLSDPAQRTVVLEWWAQAREKPDGLTDPVLRAESQLLAQAKSEGRTLVTFTDALLRAEKELGGDVHALSQALSGFNAALLGHKQTMQFPIGDPLGFEEDQRFAARVAQAIGRANRVAPKPINDFLPIRCGLLQINRLRLVDMFGRIRDVPVGEVIATEAMHPRNAGEQVARWIWLPPRLVQPTRLNFRWLSAGHGPGHERTDDQADVEMNSHPATSPVCGWLLPNNLDSSLWCYDGAGRALLYLVEEERDKGKATVWKRVPASRSAQDPPSDWKADGDRLDIANPHLQRVVEWIKHPDRGEGFLGKFITALDSALENIDPAGFAQHEALALLVGRPLAVARAEVGLEQKGLPAINQDWTVFAQRLQAGARAPDDDVVSDRVRDVLLPVRLGEHRQLDDGLAGYWREDGSAVLASAFVSCQAAPEGGAEASATAIGSAPIVTRGRGRADALNLYLSLKRPRQVVTMLVDPRGRVHATSGVLPTASVAIPPDQFAAALERIEVAFLTAPVLSPDEPDRIELPLPAEPGYGWRWLDGAAAESGRRAEIVPVKRQAHFGGRQIIRDAWLSLRPTDAAAAGGGSAPGGQTGVS